MPENVCFSDLKSVGDHAEAYGMVSEEEERLFMRLVWIRAAMAFGIELVAAIAAVR